MFWLTLHLAVCSTVKQTYRTYVESTPSLAPLSSSYPLTMMNTRAKNNKASNTMSTLAAAAAATAKTSANTDKTQGAQAQPLANSERNKTSESMLKSADKPPDKDQDQDMDDNPAEDSGSPDASMTNENNKRDRNADLTAIAAETGETKKNRIFSTDVNSGEELVSNNLDIPTLTNKQYFEAWCQLNEEDSVKAKIPFKTMDGEDDSAFYNSLCHASRTLARLYADSAIIDHNDLLKHGLTTDQWILGTATIMNNQYDHEAAVAVVSEADLNTFKITTIRLAFTPPTNLFRGNIRKSKTPATNASRAWYGAVQILGSHYARVPKQRQQKLTQAAGTTSPSSGLVQGSAVSPQALMNVATSSTSSSGSPKAVSITTPHLHRQHTARLVIKLSIKPKENQSPNVVFINLFKKLMAAYQTEDPSVLLRPWKIKSTAGEITDPENLPTQINDYKEYADRLRILANRDCWFKVHFACNGFPSNLTSNMDSASHHWFQDNQAAAFLAVVQDSDDTIDLGHLMFSGPFIDHVRLTEQIRKECTRIDPKKKFHFGCKPKKLAEIPKSEGKFTNWTMADNQPIVIEVDKQQARPFKNILYRLFNKQPNSLLRPGGYNFRILPDKQLVLQGSDSLRMRTKILRKHQAVIQSLTLLKSDDIQELDSPITVAGYVHTLRSVIQEFTYPLGDQNSSSNSGGHKPTSAAKSALFHSIDFAASGTDMLCGVAYFTAYKDRTEAAGRLITILPAYVSEFISRDAAKAWFHPNALDIITEVDLGTDLEGNWDGTWSTSEDEFNAAILAEDMGFEIEVEQGLDLDEGRVTLTADNASMQSFGTAFGRTPSPAKDPSGSSEPSPSSQSDDGQQTPLTSGAVTQSEVTQAAGSSESSGASD